MLDSTLTRQPALFSESHFGPIRFHVYSIRVRHVQRFSHSLFPVTTFLQHNSAPALAALPALQGVTLSGHLYPPIFWHNTSLSCNFDLSRQFHRVHWALVWVTSVCSNPKHVCKIPTRSNVWRKVLKENMHILKKMHIKIKALKSRKKTTRMIRAQLPARKEGSF